MSPRKGAPAPARPAELPNLVDILDELGGGLGNVIASTFRRMELAENEIQDAKQRDPLNADGIHGAFRYLRPTDPLQAKGDALYRAHCRELIERVASGSTKRELSAGTRAEVWPPSPTCLSPRRSSDTLSTSTVSSSASSSRRRPTTSSRSEVPSTATKLSRLKNSSADSSASSRRTGLHSPAPAVPSTGGRYASRNSLES